MKRFTVIDCTSGFNLNGLILLTFTPPSIVNLKCCSGTVYYCFKVRVKDVNCNVCENIVCGSSPIPTSSGPGINGRELLKDRLKPIDDREVKKLKKADKILHDFIKNGAATQIIPPKY